MPRWIDSPLRAAPDGRTATTTDFVAHVRTLIEQVLFTQPGERPMRPSFGSGFGQITFEPAGAELVATTQFIVTANLNQWLAELIAVESVTVVQEDTAVRVTVQYVVLRTRERHTDTFEQGA